MANDPCPELPANQRRAKHQGFVIESERCDLMIHFEYVQRIRICIPPFLRARLPHKEV